MEPMNIFFVSAVVTAMLLMAGFMIARNLKYKALATMNRTLASVVLICGAAMLVCNIMNGTGLLTRLPLDLSLVIFALASISVSALSSSWKKTVTSAYVVLALLLAAYYGFSAAGVFRLLPACTFRMAVAAVAVGCISVPMFTIWTRIRSIRQLMQLGTVWQWLQLAVDVFTPMAFAVLMIVYLLAGDTVWGSSLISVLMTAAIFCLCSRILSDSVFALQQRHERRIVESMRLSPIENINSVPEDENVFKELYERIQNLFEEEKPYLNGNLTINDIVSVVFSNKVYISKAISMYSGRNFCQYVNYHRVMYSMEYFRAHPETKMSELWPHCGFNTSVSFNMAFRLFMGENPSDWCRKEKIRRAKRRK